jgi:hypothetical protein
MPRVTVKFEPYNDRRYGRPWIARVADWPIGRPPVLVFGASLSLTAEIDAEPGAVVRWGQKDRRGRNDDRRWGIVQADLSVREFLDPEHCRRHWLAGCPVPDPVGNDRSAAGDVTEPMEQG